MQATGDINAGVQWTAPGPTPNAPPGAGNSNTQKPPATAPLPKLNSLIPNSASYLHAQSVADTALGLAKGDIAKRRQTAASRMGYLLNADGSVAGVDPNNPTGSYQIERGNEAEATLSSLAQARGGWGGGMVATALNRARQGINMGMTNMNRGWNDTLQGFIDQTTNAQTTHDTTLNDAWVNAWNQGIATGNYDPITGQQLPPDTPPATGGSSGSGSGSGAGSNAPIPNAHASAVLHSIMTGWKPGMGQRGL